MRLRIFRRGVFAVPAVLLLAVLLVSLALGLAIVTIIFAFRLV